MKVFLRLLTSLFKRKLKPFPPVLGRDRGAFTNQVFAPLTRYEQVMVDKAGNKIIVQYMCACGNPDYLMLGENWYFGCNHCDSICDDDNCKTCKFLMSVDFGAKHA